MVPRRERRLDRVGTFRSARTSPVAAMVGILIVDRFALGEGNLWRHGFADETSHLLTGYLCLLVGLAVGLRLLPGVVLASTVAIDIDHVPVLLRLVGTPEGTSRP